MLWWILIFSCSCRSLYILIMCWLLLSSFSLRIICMLQQQQQHIRMFIIIVFIFLSFKWFNLFIFLRVQCQCKPNTENLFFVEVQPDFAGWLRITVQRYGGIPIPAIPSAWHFYIPYVWYVPLSTTNNPCLRVSVFTKLLHAGCEALGAEGRRCRLRGSKPWASKVEGTGFVGLGDYP